MKEISITGISPLVAGDVKGSRKVTATSGPAPDTCKVARRSEVVERGNTGFGEENLTYDGAISFIPTCLAPGEIPKCLSVVSGAHRRAKIMMSWREAA